MSGLEKNVADLTVMDVYDIAAVVGQEFERIIDQHGCEALSRLMPKVVRVLEILEVMVSRSSISPETEELRLELDKLRLERLDRLEKEKKHRKVGPPRRDRHFLCCCCCCWVFLYPIFKTNKQTNPVQTLLQTQCNNATSWHQWRRQMFPWSGNRMRSLLLTWSGNKWIPEILVVTVFRVTL